MKTETAPDTPNPSKTSSFSIQSVVDKGVFFTVAANMVAASVGAAAVVAPSVGAADVVTFSAVVIS